jgi:hypothetical protein
MPQPGGEIRKSVRSRANSRCEYCCSQEKLSLNSFELDYILPKNRGGTNTLDNLGWSCRGCNSYKGQKTIGRDPVTGNLVPLYNPRTQQWNEHFDWSDDQTQIIAKTATGRATVATLRLNRETVVNLRLVLIAYGEHPPQNNPL